MKAFCIFDDFPAECIESLSGTGIDLTVLGKGKARPDEKEMKRILEQYDIVIIGTSQKIHEWMWENIDNPKIIGTASVGIDHIKVPNNKKSLLTVVNTPTANAQSVSEYTIGAMLMARKRFFEGNELYSRGKNNKSLIRKPEDINRSVVGLVGAGHISSRIMELLYPFDVRFLCYTKNSEKHKDLEDLFKVEFVSLDKLARESDIISVNVPSDDSTFDLINRDLVDKMKDTCIFISVSRPQVTNVHALIDKACSSSDFYLILDFDVLPEYVGLNNGRNIIITPHIAGGTIETRKRMFFEVTDSLIKII